MVPRNVQALYPEKLTFELKHDRSNSMNNPMAVIQ